MTKINIIKFEVVDGKKTAKAFSFQMDAKKMAKHKTEATVRKRIEDYIVENKFFKRSELKDVKIDMYGAQNEAYNVERGQKNTESRLFTKSCEG